MGVDVDFVHREIEKLRRTRKELSLQAHLGRMEVRDLWADLEVRFAGLDARARSLTAESHEALEGLGDSILASAKELAEGYERLRATLAETTPGNGTPDAARSAFERLVAGGRRAAEHVADSLEDLGDIAKLRVRGARLEWTRTRKCAELGSRIYSLAREGDLSDTAISRALQDSSLKDLIGEIGSLDADLRKIRSELEEFES